MNAPKTTSGKSDVFSLRLCASVAKGPAFYEKNFARFMAAMFLLGALLLLASAATGRGGDLINGDARERFEYARSLMIDGSLPAKRPRYPCGSAMIGLAGYAPAISISGALGSAGNGWGLPNQFAYCLPFILFALAGVRANLATLRLLGFPDSTSKPILVSWIAGTNIAYYFFKEPAMSEGPTYAALSLYYYFALRTFWPGGEEPALGARGAATNAAIAGFFLGLAGAIREQNILHCVAAPLLAAAAPRPAGISLASSFARAIPRVLIVAAASGAIFSIPFVVWSHYPKALRSGAPGHAGFDFLHPHLIAPLFSINHHGVFVWTPIFLLAAIGLCFFAKSQPRAAWAFIPPILIQYYLNASWWGFSFGTGFGNRGYFTVYPLLLPGLAALMEFARIRGRAADILKVLIALTALNLILMLLLSVGIVPANRVFGGGGG